MPDPIVKVGSKVFVVTAHDESVPAEVTKVLPGDLVDLKFVYRGETIEITSSPLDKTGKKADCWHA